MSIAITITLSLVCILIGSVVLKNAEKIHELLKCKGCPNKPESGCCKDVAQSCCKSQGESEPNLVSHKTVGNKPKKAKS